MTSPRLRLYFDFCDPLSYVASELLRRRVAEAADASLVEWIGVELRPPPTPLVTTDDPAWASRLAEAERRAAALDLSLDPPRLVPWTRKAHELVLHAAEKRVDEAVRDAVFEAYFRAGQDVGRVDVLVGIAVRAGLDRTETKAVLDVDRHEAEVLSRREEALDRGVTELPRIAVDGSLVQGFPDLTDLGTLLPD